MKNKNLNISGPKMGLGGQAKAEVIDSKTGQPVPFSYNGEMVLETPWVHNLIMNTGMNRIGTYGVSFDDLTYAVFSHCVAGTGTTSNSFSGGAETASQSGTTVTISTTIAAIEVGMVIKWDSGETAMLTAGSGTSWTAKESQTVSSGTFTVYRTNQTTAETAVTITSSEALWLSPNHTVDDLGYTIYHTQHDFAAEVADQSYTEICFTWEGTTAGDIFSRIVLPSAIAVLTGQQLRITYDFKASFTPITETASSMSITGWSTGAITEQVYSLYLSRPSYTYNVYFLDRAVFKGYLLYHKNTTMPAFSTSNMSSFPNQGGSGVLGADAVAYVTDSFKHEFVYNVGVNDLVTTGIRGFVINGTSNNNGSPYFACLFENPVDKADTHTLTIYFDVTWGRTYA